MTDVLPYDRFRCSMMGPRLTFASVQAMLWRETGDRTKWRCRSRRAVLGYWRELKQALYAEYLSRAEARPCAPDCFCARCMTGRPVTAAELSRAPAPVKPRAGRTFRRSHHRKEQHAKKARTVRDVQRNDSGQERSATAGSVRRMRPQTRPQARRSRSKPRGDPARR